MCLQHLSYWNWLAFDTFLLILEVFGLGGYCCGSAPQRLPALAYQAFIFPECRGPCGSSWSVLDPHGDFWWHRQRSAKPSDQPGAEPARQ
jgi:hypothetical protein